MNNCIPLQSFGCFFLSLSLTWSWKSSAGKKWCVCEHLLLLLDYFSFWTSLQSGQASGSPADPAQGQFSRVDVWQHWGLKQGYCKTTYISITTPCPFTCIFLSKFNSETEGMDAAVTPEWLWMTEKWFATKYRTTQGTWKGCFTSVVFYVRDDDMILREKGMVVVFLLKGCQAAITLNGIQPCFL